MNKIIVCVCTYNRAAILKKCLKSLFEITVTDYEFHIVVVDNNSTDNTKEIASMFPHIVYLNEEKQGVAYARNKFLNYCRQKSDVEYIGFIDDDEVVSRNWLEQMLNCMNSNKQIAVVCGPYIPKYFETPPPKWMPADMHNAYQFLDEENAVYKKFDALTGNCLIKYSVILESDLKFNVMLGRNGKKCLGGEDTDFFYRLVQGKYLYGFTKNAYIYHYIESKRLTFSYFQKRFFYEGVSEYYRKNPSIIPKSIFKSLIQSIHLILSLLTFNSTYVVLRYLKLVKTLGIILAPFV